MVLLTPVGKEAEMPYLHEPMGQHVQEEPPDEFIRPQGLHPEGVVVFPVPIRKGDLTVGNVHDAVIRYGLLRTSMKP